MKNQTINGYTLKHTIGEGGMAEVWYAENSIEKPAAIKILRKDLSFNEDIVTRFRNEAKIMVRLSHPNIRQVYDFGMVDERPAIIMEYLEGNDISARLKKGERFGNEKIIDWWNQLAEALSYTHAKEVVHRDIKPSNIFLTTNGKIKLLDYGIAKIKGGITNTQTGTRMGTLLYMSPEQVKDSKHLDYRTDIYSLAVTFYHLISGRSPYDSQSSSGFEIQLKIVTEILDLSILPTTWQDFLTDYLHKDPEQRKPLTSFRKNKTDIDKTQFTDRNAEEEELHSNQTQKRPNHSFSRSIIGIDLGTANSCVSVIRGNEIIIIPNSEGQRTTPSVVSFTNDGILKIGDPAKRQAITNPHQTIYSIKRFMGETFDGVSAEKERVSYKIVKGDNNTPRVQIEDRLYSPQEISAIILQKMKKTAEDYLGQTVKEAVITVPACFNDHQRQAIKEAGTIAGLTVKRLINEPLAAALAYCSNKRDMKLAVYHLGGGSFDISILEISQGVYEVKCNFGDTKLGGDDFNNEIVNWLVSEFKSDHGINLFHNPMALQRIREAAENAKIELSSTNETEINLPYIAVVKGNAKHLIKKLSRAKFEYLINTLMQKTIDLCNKAVSNSGLITSDIDEVILVGGSTLIPIVQQTVGRFFTKAPSKRFNPNEIVAIGAAIQGGILTGEIKDIIPIDVTSSSIGIETLGGIFTKLIDANTTIPCRKTETFSTASDNQPSVEIHLLQGERRLANQNKSIGRFHLDGIPPAPRGVPQIEVTFDIDSNAILRVSAKDKATGKIQSIQIETSSGLSVADIQRMKEEAVSNADSDKKELERVDKLNAADALIYQTDKSLKEYGDKLPAGKKTEIKEALEKLKTAHASQDIRAVDSAMGILNINWQNAAEEMYKNTQAGDDEVTDLDFEEVDDIAGDDEVTDLDFEEVDDKY